MGEINMNKKLKPWFIASVTVTAILTVAFFYYMDKAISGLGGGVALIMSPLPWLISYSLWCSCGFIGTAIEIRRDRPGALPIALAIVPVLLMIPTVYSVATYSPGGMFAGLAIAGLFLMLISFALPAIPMIISVVVLIVKRRSRKDDFHKLSDSTICFTRLKPLFIPLFVLCAVMPFLLVGLMFYEEAAENIAQKTEYRQTANLAWDYYESADERIDYSNCRDMQEKLFKLPTRCSTALINYDEMRVSFIFKDSLYKDCVQTYILSSMSVPPSDEMQFVCPLDGKGKEFKTYYKPGERQANNCTTYITVELADGSLWGVDTGGKWLDFDLSPCPKIAEALEHSDVLIPYGKNSAADGSLFPVYSMGIDRNTFGLDHSTMTAYVIYCDGGNTWQDVGYKKDTGEISVTSFKFEPYDGDTADFIPQAVVSLGSHDEYIVPFQSSYSNTWGSCAGVLLYTADGCYLSEENSYPWYFDFDTSEYALTDDEIADYMYGEYLNLDTSGNLIVYAKKIGDEKDDWRCAFAAYNYAPGERREILDMKYISLRSASQIIKHYSQTQQYNVVGVDEIGRVYELHDDDYDYLLRWLGLEETE